MPLNEQVRNLIDFPDKPTDIFQEYKKIIIPSGVSLTKIQA